MTSPSLNFFAPVCVTLMFVALLILRSKSTAITMFDCAVTMLVIGVYTLTQVLTLYLRHDQIKQQLATSTIAAFFDVDPTNKVQKLVRDSISNMKAADFSAGKDNIQTQNRWVALLGSGAFYFGFMALSFGVISLFWHVFVEKRTRHDISSICEACVLVIHVMGSLIFAIGLNSLLLRTVSSLPNEAAVNSCLDGITQGLSYNLIQIWNAHPELRDNLREVQDVSKTTGQLTANIASIKDEARILGSSLNDVSSDVKASLQKELYNFLEILESIGVELKAIGQKPCDAGLSSSNNQTYFKLIKKLAAAASKISTFESGRPEINILVKNLWTSSLSLLSGLKDLRTMQLCDSYQSTRDTLVKLEQYCSADSSRNPNQSVIMDNLNVLVIVIMGVVVLAVSAARLNGNYLSPPFYLLTVIAIALTTHQLLVFDCGASFSSTVDDWRLMLYSAMSAL